MSRRKPQLFLTFFLVLLIWGLGSRIVNAAEEKAESVFLREEIEQMLQGLNPREREVIILRFGLESGHPLTLEEVGKRFKVTRERIRQIETAALRKLRNPSRSKKIRDFLP